MSKLKIFHFLIIVLVSSLEGISQQPYRLLVDFDEAKIPSKPNYSEPSMWAALPSKKDMADSIPAYSEVKDMQKEATADVFFLHPTIFTYQPTNEYHWNADVNDAELNAKVDGSTILNQATVFNGSCRVYAPRYRQAHYSAFTDPNFANRKKALNVAYTDIKAAFEYYLANYNEGRPIVIASHSQGTVHAKRLLKEFFDGKSLQKQLVEAYLVGIAVQPDEFKEIKASTNAEQVGGFVTWNTFQRDFYPDYYTDGMNTAVSTNPLTWTLDENFAPKELNKGGVGQHFDMMPQAADAQNNKGILWINKPYVRGRAFLNIKIWHRADYNLFWMNIRENVDLRVAKFLGR